MRKYETNLNDAEYMVFLEKTLSDQIENINTKAQVIYEKNQEIQALKGKLFRMEDTHMPVDNIKAIIEHREVTTCEADRLQYSLMDMVEFAVHWETKRPSYPGPPSHLDVQHWKSSQIINP